MFLKIWGFWNFGFNNNLIINVDFGGIYLEVVWFCWNKLIMVLRFCDNVGKLLVLRLWVFDLGYNFIF